MSYLSLPGQIRRVGGPTHRFFTTRLPNVGPVLNDAEDRLRGASTLRPRGGRNAFPWMTVGSAIDYRIRFYFENPHPAQLEAFHAIKWHDGSEAGTALGDLVPMYGSGRGWQVPKIAKALFDGLPALTKRLQPVGRRLPRADEEELCRYCFALALLDRKMTPSTQDVAHPLKHLPPGSTLNDLLRVAPAEAVADLRELSWLFHTACSNLLGKKVQMHVSLQSSLAGASPDMLVQGRLIDIKTTVKPMVKREWLYDLIGYALFDLDNVHNIHTVGFYMARQGMFLEWPLDTLVEHLVEGEPVTRDHLRDELQQSLTIRPIQSDTPPPSPAPGGQVMDQGPTTQATQKVNDARQRANQARAVYDRAVDTYAQAVDLQGQESELAQRALAAALKEAESYIRTRGAQAVAESELKSATLLDQLQRKLGNG